MNKIIIGVIVVVVVLGGAFFVLHKNNSMDTMNMKQAQNSTSNTNVKAPTDKNAVTIQNFAFSPKTITIKKGQSITWTNEDSAGHSATADDNSWDTGVLPQGQSKSLPFTKTGTFTYHCSVHPDMHGTVIVQ